MIQKVEDNNNIWDRNKHLNEQNTKLRLRLKGKLPLQGEKNIAWDLFTVEVTKFIEYVSFTDDKYALANSSLQKYKVIN